MTTLLVGFDSAWTATTSSALVGVLQLIDRTLYELRASKIVSFREAESVILQWQTERLPTATIVLLVQPTIVKCAVR